MFIEKVFFSFLSPFFSDEGRTKKLSAVEFHTQLLSNFPINTPNLAVFLSLSWTWKHKIMQTFSFHFAFRIFSGIRRSFASLCEASQLPLITLKSHQGISARICFPQERDEGEREKRKKKSLKLRELQPSWNRSSVEKCVRKLRQVGKKGRRLFSPLCLLS